MITRRTRIQLVVFVLITLVGVSFVGARYARLDRLLVDSSYTVVAHFEDSGGIFAGGEVSYRGVRVGQVEKLELTDAGVDVYLDIDDAYDDIPADALALVGNRSAVGEQYVELQPQSDDKPFLKDQSQIAMADTRTPIPTQKLLGDISTTVESVDQQALQTTVSELGTAFAGTGEDLERIIDSGTSFIDAANANFDTTKALIRDGNVVLRGQIASASAIRTFAKQLELFTGTLAGSDKDLRKVIDNGSATANELRRFLDDNKVDLAELINELVTTGEVVVRHLPGIEQLLVVYPYVVEGGFTVVARSPDTGLYDAHFGMILTSNPEVCHAGYESTDRRPPQEGENRPMNVGAHCAEPATQSNARGAQNAPRRVGLPWRGTTAPDMGRGCTGEAASRVTFRRPDRWHHEPWEGIRGSGCSCSPSCRVGSESDGCVADRAGDADERPPPPQAPRFRRGLLVVLVAVTVVGLAGLVWLLSSRSVDALGVRGDQAQVQVDREAVMAQTEQFVLRFGTYGPDLLDTQGGMPEYRERVKGVITPKFGVSFDKQAGTAEQLVAQADISRSADVFATGVSAIDSDSATALVAGTFTDSYPKQGQLEPTPFRFEVTLVKVQGEWLVDDFTPVTGAEE